MPAKSKRSDYVILAVLGACMTAFLALAIGLGWLEDRSQEAPPIRTTYSTNPQGTMAFWMLMNQLGTPLQRLRQPFSSELLRSVDVFLVIDPIEDLTAKERACLESWVKGGGVLVHSGRLSLQGEVQTDFDIPARWRRWSYQGADQARTTPVPPDATSLPLSRDVRTVRLNSRRTLLPRGTGESHDPSAERLFVDSEGLRIAMRPLGSGRIITMSDSSFMANGLLEHGDNCILAANVVACAAGQARGARMAYDEYHLGYGSRPTSWGALWAALFGSSAGWAMLVAAISGLLYLVLRGRRFGTRRAPQRTRRRSKLEYVYSVGATYRASGAHCLALRLIYHWFRFRCASLAGLPQAAPVDSIAARLPRRTGKVRQSYQDTLRECERALAERDVSGRSLIVLLQRMGQMEMEIFNGTGTRK